MAQVKSLKTGIKFKDTPIGKIPVDWEVLPLSQIADINMGQSPSSKNCNELSKGLPFYQDNTDFGSKYPIPTKWCDKPLKIAQNGNILISVRAPVGAINISPHKCCIGRGLGAIKSTSANNDYLYQVMLYHKKSLKKVSQGSAFEAINRKDLSDFLIISPPLSEQKKIAEILSTVDAAIEETDRIIEKTKELKKGLMKNLLTRGIGHKKYKKTEIGEIPEEWVKGMLRAGAQPNINGKEYSDLVMPTPPITEQKNIVKILSYIDKEITNEIDRKQQLETLKKSLMQVLLTGKVRTI